MDEADLLCDRVAILNQGKIRDIGTPKYLKEKIHGDIILEIRAHEPEKIDTQRITAFESVKGVNLEGDQFLVSLHNREDISKIIDIFGNQAFSVNTKEPTLDDVFIQSV
jgi:ABC-2 type transport system ATP-binding protein